VPKNEWDHDENKDENLIKKKKTRNINQKIVSIKGIEFDWIFRSKHSVELMRELATTNNINLFKIEVIQDILLFHWKYFKQVLIYLFFIPFLIYFCTFIGFTTYVIKKDYEYEADKENENENWSKAALYMAIVIGVFIAFFIYVEIRQIIYH